VGLKRQSIVTFKGRSPQTPALILTSADRGKSAQNGVIPAAAPGDFIWRL